MMAYCTQTMNELGYQDAPIVPGNIIVYLFYCLFITELPSLLAAKINHFIIYIENY